ncbi:transporter [Aminobacter anthyllidis]|uniref:Transporter n=1 Tax=Aminobacter anthyllidis TaxID=1035067 RepID=A0A9X1AEH1_9HYPH|nr:transporter [Aminobacter anthyllidis]MBT1158410.1 transporter [Aminobacter anthyllidis]
MLATDDIEQNLAGAWRLMLGKADGLRLLDLSADGFWNSFFAILVAVPALVVGWAGVSNDVALETATFAGRFGIVVRLAMVDMGAWVLPLIALALVAPRAGIGDRFVHYVVASNWTSAIIAWLMLPAALTRMLFPAAQNFITLLSLAVFGLSMVFTWRMTNATIGKGAAIGSAVFTGMFFISLLVLFSLQALLGITLPA